VEIWFEDEARIGQKNGLVRQWARRGTRPRQPADQRYDNAYLFGAICPACGIGAALALPYADTDMMQLHLDEISRNVAEGAHAVLLLDRAGWHITGKLDVPENITPIFLPSRAPELNPVENVWRKRDVTATSHYAAIACEPALVHFQGSSWSILVFG
jgi:DDE superfamily endonuclease